jgi:hypothetical protein
LQSDFKIGVDTDFFAFIGYPGKLLGTCALQPAGFSSMWVCLSTYACGLPSLGLRTVKMPLTVAHVIVLALAAQSALLEESQTEASFMTAWPDLEGSP